MGIHLQIQKWRAVKNDVVELIAGAARGRRRVLVGAGIRGTKKLEIMRIAELMKHCWRKLWRRRCEDFPPLGRRVLVGSGGVHDRHSLTVAHTFSLYRAKERAEEREREKRESAHTHSVCACALCFFSLLAF